MHICPKRRCAMAAVVDVSCKACGTRHCLCLQDAGPFQRVGDLRVSLPADRAYRADDDDPVGQGGFGAATWFGSRAADRIGNTLSWFGWSESAGGGGTAVTEQEWLDGAEVKPLLGFLFARSPGRSKNPPPDERFRRFGIACCRRLVRVLGP